MTRTETIEQDFKLSCDHMLQRLKEMAKYEEVSIVLAACDSTKSSISEGYTLVYMGLPAGPKSRDIAAYEDLKKALTLRLHRTLAFIEGMEATYHAWQNR